MEQSVGPPPASPPEHAESSPTPPARPAPERVKAPPRRAPPKRRPAAPKAAPPRKAAAASARGKGRGTGSKARSRSSGAGAGGKGRSVTLQRVAMPPVSFPVAPPQGMAPPLATGRLAAPAATAAPAAPPPQMDGRLPQLLLLSAPFLGFALASQGFTDRLLGPMLFLEEGFAGLALAGSVALVGFLAFGLAQAAGGAWSDGLRSPHGARWPALLSAGAFAAMALVLSFAARGAGGILFAFLLLQASLGVAVAAAQPLLAETVPPPRRGLGAGLRGSFEFAGLLAAGGLVEGVLAEGSAATPLLGALVLVVGGTAACAVALRRLTPPPHARPLPAPAEGAAPEPAPQPSVLAALRAPLDRRFARAALGRGALALGGFLFLYSLDALLGARLAPAVAGEAGGLLTTALVVLLAGSLGGGALSDRVGRRAVLQGGVFLGATGSALLLLASRPLEFLVFGALAAGGAGAALAASWALLADLAPPRTAGRHLGLAGFAAALAAVVALLLLGEVPAEGLALLAALALAGGWFALRPVAAPPRPPGPARFTVVRPPARAATAARSPRLAP